MSKHKEKEFDAIAMKRDLQEKFYEETKGLSAEELIAYMHRKIANSEFADFLSHPGPLPVAATADKG